MWLGGGVTLCYKVRRIHRLHQVVDERPPPQECDNTQPDLQRHIILQPRGAERVHGLESSDIAIRSNNGNSAIVGESGSMTNGSTSSDYALVLSPDLVGNATTRERIFSMKKSCWSCLSAALRAADKACARGAGRSPC